MGVEPQPPRVGQARRVQVESATAPPTPGRGGSCRRGPSSGLAEYPGRARDDDEIRLRASARRLIAIGADTIFGTRVHTTMAAGAGLREVAGAVIHDTCALRARFGELAVAIQRHTGQWTSRGALYAKPARSILRKRSSARRQAYTESLTSPASDGPDVLRCRWTAVRSLVADDASPQAARCQSMIERRPSANDVGGAHFNSVTKRSLRTCWKRDLPGVHSSSPGSAPYKVTSSP